MKANWPGIIVAVLPAAGAFGAGMRVLDTTIEAAPGQEVVIMATGAGDVIGVNLQLQVGDGGAVIGGTDVAGVDAAPITHVDFHGGTIWDAAGTLAETQDLHGLIAFPWYVVAGYRVAVPTPGKLATLTLDGSGLSHGTQFTIALEIPWYGVASDWAGPPADELIAGTITVAPEPGVWLSLLAAGPALGWRRRRMRG